MTAFFLLSGAGNDFIALVDPASTPTATEMRRWCRRGAGVGADGVLVLERRGEGWDEDALLSYFNADGGAADLCINGTRCAARLADHLGWTEGEGRIRTGAGLVQARALGVRHYEVEAPPPPSLPKPRTLHVDEGPYAGWRVDVGVPHFVVFAEELTDPDFENVARALRHHPELQPEGANIDFAEPSGRGFRIRSFERGVEGETLSCGTGALAVAAAAIAAEAGRFPILLETQGGFVLEVKGTTSQNSIVSWSLAGDVRLLAEGTLHPDAAEDCPPTRGPRR